MDVLMNELKHLGLSDKESSVYLAALELGPSPVQDISHKAKVNRATTYVMIESLTTRGLLSTFVKGKKRFYAAESPDRLVSILEKRQKELDEKKAELESVMPMLHALFNAEGAKPQIRYLEGAEGLETVRTVFEKLEGEFVQIYYHEQVQRTEEIIHGQGQHHTTLLQKKTPHRVLLVVEDPDHVTLPEMGEGEFRMLPKEKFPIQGSVTVRGNHVFMYSYKSSILSVIIVSKEIAEVIKALFELAWVGAEGYPSKKLK